MMRSLLLGLVLVLTGCSNDAEQQSDAELVSHTFTIEGMTCDKCVSAITHALERTDGVAECTITLDDGSAIVKTDAATSTEALVAVVNDLNYQASSD